MHYIGKEHGTRWNGKNQKGGIGSRMVVEKQDQTVGETANKGDQPKAGVCQSLLIIGKVDGAGMMIEKYLL